MGTYLPRNDGSQFFSNNPREDLIGKLVEKTISAGHLLTFEETSDDPKMFRPNSYAFYYGSFGEAAQTAWRKAKTILSQKTKEPEEEKSEMFTFEEVKVQLIRYYKKHGRLPTQLEVMSDPNLPSWTTLNKFLGPKSEWGRYIPSRARPLPQTNGSSNPSQPTSSLPTQYRQPLPVSHPVISKTTDDAILIEVSEQKDNGDVIIKAKISIPNREKPILVTLTA